MGTEKGRTVGRAELVLFPNAFLTGERTGASHRTKNIIKGIKESYSCPSRGEETRGQEQELTTTGSKGGRKWKTKACL